MKEKESILIHELLWILLLNGLNFVFHYRLDFLFMEFDFKTKLKNVSQTNEPRKKVQLKAN